MEWMTYSHMIKWICSHLVFQFANFTKRNTNGIYNDIHRWL